MAHVVLARADEVVVGIHDVVLIEGAQRRVRDAGLNSARDCLNAGAALELHDARAERSVAVGLYRDFAKELVLLGIFVEAGRICELLDVEENDTRSAGVEVVALLGVGAIDRDGRVGDALLAAARDVEYHDVELIGLGDGERGLQVLARFLGKRRARTELARWGRGRQHGRNHGD